MEVISTVTVNLKTILGVAAAAVLFFFGIIFALAAAYSPIRFLTAAFLLAVGFAIAYYLARKPKMAIQKLEVSGELRAIGLKCLNCGASVDVSRIKVVSGIPYATCQYCGHTFEVAEEPKW